MSPKKKSAPIIKRTTVLLPLVVHNAARQVAAGLGQSLSTWAAATLAREAGMAKSYTAPHWGKKKTIK